MAENDQNNDEYKFAELDSLDNESMHEAEPAYNTSRSTETGQKNVKRNALMVVGVIVLAMVIYKLSGIIFSGKDKAETSQASITPINQESTQQVQKTITPPVTPTPVVVQPQPVSTTDNDLKQKVNAIEQAQQSVRAEVNTVGQQVGTVNNNVNNLNTQIANLNQTIANLTTQLAKQSEEITILMARSQPKKIKIVRPKMLVRPLVYYIQAVIPGRAWLIGSNGSTITVREGTKVAGYGTVKLIDSLQGRILTSSGHIIRFSQEDS